MLTANVPEREDFSLCKANLAMPTEITGQNGAVLEQKTMIAASGCAGVLPDRTVKLSRAQLLSRALAACRRRYKHSRSRQAACERQARKRYAAHKPHAGATTSAGGRNRAIHLPGTAQEHS